MPATDAAGGRGHGPLLQRSRAWPAPTEVAGMARSYRGVGVACSYRKRLPSLPHHGRCSGTEPLHHTMPPDSALTRQPAAVRVNSAL